MRKEVIIVEALNIVFVSEDWRAVLLSNLAAAPFSLWGYRFASVEGLWQGLKFDEGSEQQQMCFGLSGIDAKRAGSGASKRDSFTWLGRCYTVGSAEHQDLMRQALIAKLQQNPMVRMALVATKGKHLVHALQRDSVTIPGAVFAGTWMEIRTQVLEGTL